MFAFGGRRAFTMLELVLVMAVIGILAFAAITRFNLSTNNLDASARVLRSNLQLAQDWAMTLGTTYGFRSVNSTSYEIYETAPGNPATNPLTNTSFVVNISPVQFSGSPPTVPFLNTGVPNIVVDTVITMTDGGGTRTITIKKNTGLVTVSP